MKPALRFQRQNPNENGLNRLRFRLTERAPPERKLKFFQKGVVSLQVLGLTVLVLTNNAVKSR
jgi:hypothetical protein